MLAFTQDWVYRWKHARALLHRYFFINKERWGYLSQKAPLLYTPIMRDLSFFILTGVYG
jgi:hypothetical protein